MSADIRRNTIVKAAYQAQKALSPLAKGRVLHSEQGKLEGIGVVAADVLHICMTPWGFALAVTEAVREVGEPDVPTASSRERAVEARAKWEDAVVEAVERRLI